MAVKNRLLTGCCTAGGKYEWGTANNVDMRFTIQGDVVLVGDRAGSTYITSTGAPRLYTDGSHEYAWKARDENGISCIFKLINYSDGSKLTEVFYSDYAYRLRRS